MTNYFMPCGIPNSWSSWHVACVTPFCGNPNVSIEEILAMRVLIVFAALVLLFALIGWITFSNDQGQSSINLETNEIREDTSEMMHQGSELLKDAEQEVSPSTANTDNAAAEPSTNR
jgi:hypothetical protein